MNSSLPDGLNSEIYGVMPQLTNKSPFLVVSASPKANPIRPSGWLMDLTRVAVCVLRSSLTVIARL